MALIEREHFITLLQNGFDEMAAGKGHCFFIMGEAGVGKSALVNNFLETVENQCVSFIGVCDSLFTPRPLAPVIDLAIQLKSGWTDGIESTISRSDLFSGFVEELMRKKDPVVLVFEDIHWADEATLDFIKFLSRRIARTRCMFILTCRNTEFAGLQLPSTVLSDIAPDTFTRLALPLLSLDAVQKMAQEKGYNGENLYTLTGGNPFFVTEILASYSPGIPENVKDAVLSVFNKHEGKTRDLWQLLSVVPDGFLINQLSRIDPEWDDAIEQCINARVLVLKNNKLLFKHELYRRTVEESLSPFRRIKLNKTILDLFLSSFEMNGEIEKIVHHAKNANENALVTRFAPMAAKQASLVGSHLEAAKLYLTAIQYAESQDEEKLVTLYEAYAYEAYLTNQIKEAIIYQGKALAIWKSKQQTENIGNNLWFLSRLWWFDGNTKEAERYAHEAVAVLETQPSSRAKGMAFSSMSQLKMYAHNKPECVTWGHKAIAIANEINDPCILSHALTNMGTVLWEKNDDSDQGKQYLFKSLSIAMEHGLDEHAARAQSNIVFQFILLKDYASAQKHLDESINYCEERDLNSSKSFKNHLKAKILFETGKWKEAETVIEGLLKYMTQPSVIKIGALTILAKIKIRRGDEDCVHFLKIIKNMALKVFEYQRILPVAIACLEYEWLTADKLITDEEMDDIVALTKKVEIQTLHSEFVYWYRKAKNITLATHNLYLPYQYLQQGKIQEAAIFWDKLPCPFEKAMVLTEGKEEEKKQALLLLQQLGAIAFGEKLKKMMRSAGIKKIPRGIRASTQNNPAQLTNREVDVLRLLQQGAQNKEIATALFISPKTVDHHISSLLFKLDVTSRTKAVTEAIRIGILK